MEINIGGYDKNTFYERLGINYLERELLYTYRIIPCFNVNDKTPNLDGWLDLCDKNAETCLKAVPQHRFSVQIKTLNHDYLNTNSRKSQEQQYKYSCDTKVLNTVLTNATLDPILLFLVDWKTEQVFWKYLSMEYCFSFLDSPEKKTFTLYFSDCDKIDFSTDTWIEQLIQIKMKQRAELSNSTANLFMVSTGDPEVIQQIRKASDSINGLMEWWLQFLRQALFPNTWKFGIAFFKSETGMISAGVYRVVTGMNNEFFKVFDEDNDQMIFSCRGAEINVSSVVENYLVHCVRYFFSSEAFTAQLPYLPDLVLNEIAFEELDNRFLYLQSSVPARTLKTGDKVYYGLQVNELSLNEYDELKEQGRVTIKSEACIHELRQRGYRKLVRPWRKSFVGTLGELRREKISKEFFVNAEQFDLPDEITFHSCSIPDMDEVEIENTQRLLQDIQKFYDDSCRKLGTAFYHEIGHRQIYVFAPVEVVDELKQLDYPNFMFATEEKKRRAIMGSSELSKCYHHLKLEDIDFSWYRIWRILFRNMILWQFKETDIPNLPVQIEFLTSK